MKRRRQAEPLNPHAIGDHMMAFAIPFVVGLALGGAVMLGLWAAKLRWTWALWGGPVAFLAWSFDWQIGVALTSATAVAAGCGAYWHWQDLERRGEQARQTRERIGPLRWAWSRRQVKRARGSRIEDGRLALGAIRRGGVCRVPVGLDRGVHAFIIGATGAGKTVTQAAIAQAYVLAGLPAIVLDPKGDRYLRAVLKDAAEQAGARFIEWSPSGPTVYNPFGRGGPTEIADNALAGHRWSEPHYELATQRLLGHVLNTMRAAGTGRRPSRRSSASWTLSARGKADLGGGRDRLAVLVEGEIEPKSPAAKRAIPILSVLRGYLVEEAERTGRTGRDRFFGRSAHEVFYASTVDGRAKRAWRAYNADEREAAAGEGREPELLTLLTMHECRHTFASVLIDTGANPKAIQEVMGHSKIQTTFDVYGHLLPGSYDDIRARMDAYLAATA
jgi:hypothetical protein